MKRYLSLSAALLGVCAPALATVTGQWDFNNGTLAATIGADLAYRGDTATITTFPTATIGGQTAKVMALFKYSSSQGFTMTHGIAPNGGGSYVNKYTLIMDLMFPSSSSGAYRALLQTSTANNNDADLFVNKANGIGSGSYSGVLTPDTWHRVGFVVDLSLSSGQLQKYIDGALVGSQNLSTPVLDGKLALDPTAFLFTDDDGETAPGFVNSIQIHDVPLTANDLYALGGPSAAGIPTTIPTLDNVVVTVSPAGQTNTVGLTGTHFRAAAAGTGTLTYQWYRNGVAIPEQTAADLRLTNVQASAAGSYTVIVGNGTQWATSTPPAVLTINPAKPTKITGQWDFNNGDLSATTGQPLGYFDDNVKSETVFASTTAFGISDIAGQPANIMCYLPTVSKGGYVVTNGMSANGGGTNVNQYTVIIDLLYPSSSGGFRSLWQADPSNTTDGDLFFNGNNGLGLSSAYDGYLTPDAWHRVVFTLDLTKRELGKYLDGTNVLHNADGSSPYGPNDAQYLSTSSDPLDGGSVDMRWSLRSTSLLLADNDGEVQQVYVSSVQIREGRMTDVAIAALGTPTANKIPGWIQARAAGTGIQVDWTGSVLETAPSLTGPWTEVTGAAHPYIVTTPTGTGFFRVKQ
jgi:hypothetical protein